MRAFFIYRKRKRREAQAMPAVCVCGTIEAQCEIVALAVSATSVGSDKLH